MTRMRARPRRGTSALWVSVLVGLAGCGQGDVRSPAAGDAGRGGSSDAGAGATEASGAGTANAPPSAAGRHAGSSVSSAGLGGSLTTTAAGVNGLSAGNGGTGAVLANAGGAPASGGTTAAGATSTAAGRASVGGGGAGGAGRSSGAGAGGVHSSGGASGGPYPDLRFSGLVSAVELAPLRLATNGPYPAKVTIASGGVDALCGSNPSADIATNAETQLLRATGMGGCDNVRIIFTMCEGLYRIVAKKSAGITTLADLAGKRVMAPSGASSAYYLSRMLAAANLTTVNVVSGNPNGSTFSGGSAPDAATIWEPGIEQAAEELGSDAIIFEHDANDQEVYRELFNLHTTTEVLADPAKRRGVVELVRDLVAASASLRAAPSAASALLTGPTGVSASVLAQSMKYERFAGTLVSDVLDVMTEEEPWRANIDGRSARSRDELATYIDTSVLADAMAGM